MFRSSRSGVKRTSSPWRRFTTLPQVAGQANAIEDAKGRDIERFLAFYFALFHHYHPHDWHSAVTRSSDPSAYWVRPNSGRMRIPTILPPSAAPNHNHPCKLDEATPLKNAPMLQP
jgi:hypothetical protein